MAEKKPLATFAIFFYNQRDYVSQAVNAALAQDYENLEILFSDDCSPDGTFEEIQECVKGYEGPHKIILNKNEKNLGIAGHVNKVLYELCSGDYIVLGAGDDVSMPIRVSRSVNFFEANPEIQSLSFESLQVDKDLNTIEGRNIQLSNGLTSILTLDDYCSFKDFLIFSGDSRALRKNVVDKFPPFSDAKEEDLELFVRSLILGPIAYIREPLVKRRIDGNNVSKRAIPLAKREAQNRQLKKDVLFGYEQKYIRSEQKDALLKKADELMRILVNVDNSRRHPLLYKVFRGISKGADHLGYSICKSLK